MVTQPHHLKTVMPYIERYTGTESVPVSDRRLGGTLVRSVGGLLDKPEQSSNWQTVVRRGTARSPRAAFAEPDRHKSPTPPSASGDRKPSPSASGDRKPPRRISKKVKGRESPAPPTLPGQNATRGHSGTVRIRASCAARVCVSGPHKLVSGKIRRGLPLP